MAKKGATITGGEAATHAADTNAATDLGTASTPEATEAGKVIPVRDIITGPARGDFPAIDTALDAACEEFGNVGFVLRVTAPKNGGVRRGGIRHEGTVDHEYWRLTPEQVEAILTEPRLTARFVPEGFGQE